MELGSYEITICRKKSDYIRFIIQLMFGLLLPTVILYLNHNFWVVFILVLLFCREYLYKQMDFLLPIRLYTYKETIYISYFFTQFELNAENSFLIIEDISSFFPSKTSNLEYGLVLVRNPDRFSNRIFKNRIKLHSIQKDGVEGLIIKMNNITESIGIRNVEFFKDPYDW